MPTPTHRYTYITLRRGTVVPLKWKRLLLHQWDGDKQLWVARDNGIQSWGDDKIKIDYQSIDNIDNLIVFYQKLREIGLDKFDIDVE